MWLQSCHVVMRIDIPTEGHSNFVTRVSGGESRNSRKLYLLHSTRRRPVPARTRTHRNLQPGRSRIATRVLDARVFRQLRPGNTILDPMTQGSPATGPLCLPVDARIVTARIRFLPDAIVVLAVKNVLPPDSPHAFTRPRPEPQQLKLRRAAIRTARAAVSVTNGNRDACQYDA